MKGLIEFLADRKETIRLLPFMHCAVAMVILTACASQKEFQKGYAQGSGDTVKRQYWIEQNMQKAGKAKAPRLTLYRIPVKPDLTATIKTVPYEITIPIYE
jgi:hypothetical protein